MIMPPAEAVEVTGLVHHYGRHVALDGVDFTVAPGEIFALLGPNGGGKSTVFRILATLLRPSRGRAVVLGHDVVQAAHAVRRRIGVMFQSPSVDGKLSVVENLAHHGHLYGLHGRSLAGRMDVVLEQVGLADRRRERVEKLSGGLMRRVEIAKSLMHEPQVLLLDEPSTGLDPAARRRLRRQLEDLRQNWGVTCLLTTHLMDEAATCDRVGILDRGKLVALDTPRSLTGAIGGDVITVTTDRPAVLRGRIKAGFGVDVQMMGDTLRIEHQHGHDFAAKLADAFPEELACVSVGRPTLDDVFIKHTGHRLEEE